MTANADVSAANEAQDRADIALAESHGFVREPTLGGQAAYDDHIAEDAIEARTFLASNFTVWRHV